MATPKQRWERRHLAGAIRFPARKRKTKSRAPRRLPSRGASLKSPLLLSFSSPVFRSRANQHFVMPPS